MEQTSLLWAIGAGLLVMLISLVGVTTTFAWFRTRIEKEIDLLSSFSAGVFCVVGLLLLRELFEHTEIRTLGFTAAATGAAFILILSQIPEFHHHHSESENEEKHTHSRSAIRRILTSDGLHNIGDGVLIGAAFATNITLGIVTTIGIAVHELLQELSEFFLLRQAGFSSRRALLLNFLISSTVFIGIALSIFLVDHEKVEGFIIGLSAGAILAVVFHDLIPNSAQISREEEKVWRHVFVFVLGGLLMFALSLLIKH